MRTGDLEALAFAGDHVTVNCGDEWNTLPYLIRSTEGHGSRFSMVDIPLTQRHVEWVAEKTARPAWSAGPATRSTGATWPSTCGSAPGARSSSSWRWHRPQAVDQAFLCRPASSRRSSRARCSSPPRRGKAWPSRARGAAGELSDYTPAAGRRELDADELARLAAKLTDLAGSLVGGPLFKGLFSLLTSELADRKPTFAFVARTGEDHHVFEYVPTRCRFAPAHTDGTNPRTAYLAGLACWASDLLAVLDGALGPIASTYGRVRLWNALPQRFHFDIF